MSRYPTFESNPSYPYDHNLLAHAPAVTRADRQVCVVISLFVSRNQVDTERDRAQAGYDIGIIERGVLPYRPYQAPNPFIDSTPTATNWRDKELPSHPITADSPSPVPSYTHRWYRTKRGIAIIILVVLIVISLIVGVAVGVSGEQKRQAAAIAAVDADSTTPDTVTSTSSPVIPSSTARNSPHSTLGPVHSTPTPSLSVVPLITPSTGTPQATRPLTPAPSTSTSSGSVKPSQGGNDGNSGQDEPWYCKVLPFVC